jgi:hypothetical protein
VLLHLRGRRQMPNTTTIRAVQPHVLMADLPEPFA